MATDADVNVGGGSAFTQEKSQLGIDRERKRRRARWLLVGVVALVLVGAGTGSGLYLTRSVPPPPQPPCLSCISDGSHAFGGDTQAMRAVIAAIGRENAAVRARKGRRKPGRWSCNCK